MIYRPCGSGKKYKNAVENKPPPLAKIFDPANGGGSNINIIKQKIKT